MVAIIGKGGVVGTGAFVCYCGEVTCVIVGGDQCVVLKAVDQDTDPQRVLPGESVNGVLGEVGIYPLLDTREVDRFWRRRRRGDHNGVTARFVRGRFYIIALLTGSEA